MTTLMQIHLKSESYHAMRTIILSRGNVMQIFRGFSKNEHFGEKPTKSS
ncbi:hypothetical protein PROSTU_00655, partial [Providencia stuartii ATCC 25827]